MDVVPLLPQSVLWQLNPSKRVETITFGCTSLVAQHAEHFSCQPKFTLNSSQHAPTLSMSEAEAISILCADVFKAKIHMP